MQNRVIDLTVNLPVVHQEGIRNIAEPFERLFIFTNKRLIGNIAAGHHQDLYILSKQQIVQRRVAQHKTVSVNIFGNRWSYGTVRFFAQQDNRALGTAQRPLGRPAHNCIFFYLFD